MINQTLVDVLAVLLRSVTWYEFPLVSKSLAALLCPIAGSGSPECEDGTPVPRGFLKESPECEVTMLEQLVGSLRVLAAFMHRPDLILVVMFA